MTELKKWENSEIVALLRNELQYVAELTDTGKLDDVGDEIERRLDLTFNDVRQFLTAYREEQLTHIIDNQMQLVTAEEFSKLHREKLASERSAEILQKQNKILKQALVRLADPFRKNVQYKREAEKGLLEHDKVLK